MGGLVNVTLATVVGACVGFACSDLVLPSGLTPEQFGEQAASNIITLSLLGGVGMGTLEWIRWHYSRH
jgi:hypothetical protein